ncbi:MAG TPA: hypothetical protein VFP84_21495, partial [Kofleriaceae bacterium]|nr:hypothetical protein [Kofleriaceae bacterium]
AAVRAVRIAIGGIPLVARLHYQQAIAQPSADLAAQLAALDDLWAATAVARLAVLLARSG